MGSREIDMEDPPQHSEEEDEEELEEGPPPGFQCIPQSQQESQGKVEQDYQSSDNGDTDDDDDEVNGPPPGFSTPQALPSDVEMGDKESDTDEDDGPPPGWGTVTGSQPHPHETPSVSTAPDDIVDVKMVSRQNEDGDKIKFPLLGSQASSQQESLSPLPPLPPPSATAVSSESRSIQGDMKGDVQEPQPKRQSLTPSLQKHLPPPLPPPPRGATSAMGQLVCGSCRQLLSYPQGAKYVKCSPCQTVNLVLEAHQVGQVKCGRCSVLLMYPHGSPAVRCSSCRFVTDIGAHNRRPPLSEQQARRQQLSGSVHLTAPT